MSVRPRPALAGCLVAAIVLHLLTRVSGVSWLALFSGGALALPVVSVLARPRYSHLSVRLQLPARVTAGELVEGQLALEHTGRTPTPAGSWVLHHPGFAELSGDLPALRPGDRVLLPIAAVAQSRGVYAGSVLDLASSAPFGVLQWSSQLPLSERVIVHPSLSSTRHLEAEGAPTAAEHSVPVPGHGAELLGLRPWRQGDALRHLSARATARHGRPVVLERERETGPSLVVLAVGGGSGASWERAVARAASLAVAALREGRPPVIVADVPPVRIDAVGLLDFFAGVDAVGNPTGQDVSRALAACGAGGTLALLAPHGAAEMHARIRGAASAAGVRVEVIS